MCLSICIFVFLTPQIPVLCHVDFPKQPLIFNFSRTGPSAVSCWCSRLSPQPLIKPSLFALFALAPSFAEPWPCCTCLIPPHPPPSHEEPPWHFQDRQQSCLCLAAPHWGQQGCCRWGCTEHPRWRQREKILLPLPWGDREDHQINCI